MTHNPSIMSSEGLRADFSYAQLDTPLKDAPIVSLRSLEDGEHDFEDAPLRSVSIWRRVIMSLRKRATNGKSRREPIRLQKQVASDSWRTWKRRTWVWIGCMTLSTLVLCFFGIVHLVNVLSFFTNVLQDDSAEHPLAINWAQAGVIGDGGPAAFPTDLTRDVVPIPCHSHNDYWRKIPLYEALAFGCTGVEADVWLFNEDLFVGHNTNALTRNRTFRSMYVNPIVELLDRQNAANRITSRNPTSKNGVFETEPSQSLVLLVDFKNDGHEIFPYVSEQLQALREKSYLTYFNGETTISGPITVVATGNAPFDLITSNTTYRDIFFDAPLDRMYEEPVDQHRHRVPKFTDQGLDSAPTKRASGQGSVGTDENSHFDTTNSFYASVSFSKSIGHVWWGKLSHKQIQIIKGQIQGAKRRGLKARYWSTPKWPVSLRNHVWDVLVREGVDYLNGDDLRGMTHGDWRKKKHHGWLGKRKE